MSETPTPDPAAEQSDAPAVRPRVAVVFGGRSSEHGISCVTAGSVLAAIDPTEYDVVPIGIAPDGRWVLESGEPEALAIGAGGALPQVSAARPVVRLEQDGGAALTVQEPGEVPRALGAVDVVLPLLHGPFGEDGTLQGLLELADVAYVGAGVLASAVSMDKHYMKVVLRSAGLPVLPHVLVTPHGWENDREACPRERARARLPRLRQALPGRVEHRHQQGPRRGRAGRGGRGRPRARPAGAGRELRRARRPRGRDGRAGERGRPRVSTSVAAEILVDAEHEFYDFAAKYLPEEATDLRVPADLEEETEAELRRLAGEAFLALGIEGLARVDFFVQDGGRVVINEGEHHAGLHPDLDVPADVGGLGRRLRHAGAPAADARPRAHHRPALRRHRQRPTARVCALTAGARSLITSTGGRKRAGTVTRSRGERPIVVITTRPAAAPRRSAPSPGRPTRRRARGCRPAPAPGRRRAAARPRPARGRRAAGPARRPARRRRRPAHRSGAPPRRRLPRPAAARPRPAAGGAVARGRASDVDDGAGEGAGDPGHGLDPGDDHLAELVDVGRLRAHDDVVRTGDVLGEDDALEVRDLGRHLRGLAHVGLDQDVGLHHHVLAPSSRAPAALVRRPTRETYTSRACRAPTPLTGP
ncbi:hypothetical protein LUZ63_020632 [Rhynchospora breviuscula]|uniref:ATP-grasp domain-containing protein n=1 Tax=Rhynchospora breviuscula TaxID=2022672 RepID=A0A9Q0C0I8_9POAL|nr:hypothetical protein LUZ63_020632 [Rhynchospora breviuscula]